MTQDWLCISHLPGTYGSTRNRQRDTCYQATYIYTVTNKKARILRGKLKLIKVDGDEVPVLESRQNPTLSLSLSRVYIDTRMEDRPRGDC